MTTKQSKGAIVPFPAQVNYRRNAKPVPSTRIAEWLKPRESEFISRSTVIHLRLPIAAKMLLIILRAFQCPDTGRCEPSLSQLARSCGTSVPTVIRARSLLKRNEMISWEGQGVCRYRFLPKSINRIPLGSIDEQGISRAVFTADQIV